MDPPDTRATKALLLKINRRLPKLRPSPCNHLSRYSHGNGNYAFYAANANHGWSARSSCKVVASSAGYHRKTCICPRHRLRRRIVDYSLVGRHRHPEAISLPESLLKAGFTPVGAADEFPEQMRSVTRDSEWARFVSFPFFRPTELPETIRVETKTNT
jgi:hypothetical protein